MSWTRRRYQIAAAVPVVVVFAGLYAWSLPTGQPAEVYGYLAALFVWPTMLWLGASLALVDRWWRSSARRLSTMDTPGQVLALTVATLPMSRRRWGEAMLGELAQVQGRAARWRFALSCARAALFLPLPTRRTLLATAVAGMAAVAVAVAHPVAGAAVPGLGFFAAGFVAIVGVVVVLAIARARPVRPPVPAATVLVAGAVAAAVAALAVFLLQHPTAAEALSPARSAVLATALAGCLWLAAAPSGPSGSSRLSRYLGVGAAVVLNLGGLAAGRTDVEGLAPLVLLFGPTLTFGGTALIAAAVGRSFHAGVQAGVWTAIMVMPLNWAVALFDALHRYAIDGVFRFAGDISTAGFNLGFMFMTFLAIPTIGFPFAVFGALLGAALRGSPSARNGAPEGPS